MISSQVLMKSPEKISSVLVNIAQKHETLTLAFSAQTAKWLGFVPEKRGELDVWQIYVIGLFFKHKGRNTGTVFAY